MFAANSRYSPNTRKLLSFMTTTWKREYLVLLADDSQDDRMLLGRVLGKCERLRLLGPVVDGAQTIAYLNGDGEFANREIHPFPDLLLLDLRMPRVDGFQVLRWLRNTSFPSLLVVVFSGSDHYADISKAVGLGAHLYHTKQLGSERQLAVLKNLEQRLCQPEPAGWAE
jgi:CheY-like chemotaxis protein